MAAIQEGCPVQRTVRFELTSLSAIALLTERCPSTAPAPDWPEGSSLMKLPIAHAACVRGLRLLWLQARLGGGLQAG